MRNPTDAITFNIENGEVLQPGAIVKVHSTRPIDPRFAQGAIGLTLGGCPAGPVALRVAPRGRTLEVATADLEPGVYRLALIELLGSKGERLVEERVIEFSIVPIAGKVPAKLRVEHTVRLVPGDLEIQRLAPGERSKRYVDVVKAVDRETGEPVELAFDQDGARVDPEAVSAGVQERRFRKFGRIHETLWNQIEGAKDGQRIGIIIWPRLDLPPAPYDKPSDGRVEEAPEGERTVADLVGRARSELRALLRQSRVTIHRGDDKAEGSDPFLRATATVGQIRELARNDAVGVILFDDTSEIEDLGDSIAVARSDLAHAAGFDGTGIRVAVWESGPSVTKNLTFAGRFTTSPAASDHARLTSAVVKNVEPNLPHGHAPDCDLYSANTGGVDALRWAVATQNCTVVSQSFHRGTEASGSSLQADDLLKDWLALRWPYPTILQAAGNYWLGDPDGISPPESEYVNHKGYNSLAVGNHDDSAGAMSGDSVFRNPVTTHGDRELPELSANGTGVSANEQTMSGTSFAAPAAAGVTALLQDVDSVLCSWPEGCRAILLASAGRNVAGRTWWPDVAGRVDGLDGAGAVDARESVAIAQQRRWRDAPATRRGWDVGTLSSAAIGADRLATFRYRIAVPLLLRRPIVKVALAWDSAVTSSGETATASTLTVDLDVLVRNSAGTQVAAAASWDNSYEVAEFSAAPGETYDVVIRRWSGTDSVWFGVAWSVSGSLWFQSVDLARLEVARALATP